jgi:hypothetical protein
MPLRWYLSDIIGNGTEANPYRSRIADFGVSHTAVIPNAKDGTPKHAFCLVLVQATLAQHQTINAQPTILGFPFAALGDDASTLNLPSLDRLTLATRWIVRNQKFRDFLNSIGQQLDPNFDADFHKVV